MDRSNGYEGIAAEFLAGRGTGRGTGIGVPEVRAWARSLPPGAAVLDLGCGPGFPITEVLVLEGLRVHAIDASPTFVEVFRRNLAGIPVACEPAEDSSFFDRSYDAVLAWGLMFLLPIAGQHQLIQRVAAALNPGGRFLFTAPAEPLTWQDAMTDLESRSLGAHEYGRLLSAAGLTLGAEYEDVGENHYFDAIAPRS